MDNIKIIAKYLPQFYRTPENDLWWGEGFTEWTAVKNAIPLFEGHLQPVHPLNENYYNLLNKETMEWQASLMQKYGIDGMCFYHYWFKNGKKILEKPAENLLSWSDIKMPFCFCWANESWVKTWSNAGNGNAWVDGDRAQRKLSDDGILLEQRYGGQKEWKDHFDYLLPFFKDKRYIRYEGKPVFLIYKPLSMPCVFNMIQYWRKLAFEEGLSGLYIIGENLDKKYIFDARLLGEPAHIFHSYFEGEHKITYSAAVEAELSSPKEEGTFYGAFTGYDNSPRMGAKGNIVIKASASLFERQMEGMIQKNLESGKGILFVNAWNEWGEGMHLEPDVMDNYSYLQAAYDAKKHYREYKPEFCKDRHSFLTGPNAGLLDKYDRYWHVLDIWMKLKERGLSISAYFKRNGYNSAAVYGCGMLGKHLITELESQGIQIDFLVDRDAEKIDTKYNIFTAGDCLPNTDVIVVTVPDAYADIYMELRANNIPIISIEEVVMETEI